MVDPTNAPGERRLAHPPSDRYRMADADRAPRTDAQPSGARGLVLAGTAGLGGAGAIALLGGVLTVTAGLVVVAAATGWVVGTSLERRRRLAVTIALLSVAVGQAGLWAYGRSEGGVLAPLDFLWQVYGGLVPLQLAAAAITAWIAAR